MAIQIPAPLPSDSEKVVNLLQNAALFGRIGDAEEAVNWLRRAAECAGESGDDARTLVLARTAAELSTGTASRPTAGNGAEGRSGVHEKRLPMPPPRSRPLTPADAAESPASSKASAPNTVPASSPSHGPVTAASSELEKTPRSPEADAALDEEPVLLLKRTAPHSKPPAKAPDPVAKTLAPAAADDKSADSRPPDSRATLSPPPLPRVRANGSRPPLASTRPAPASSRSAASSSRPHTGSAVASRSTLSRPPVSTAAASLARGSVAPASTRSYAPAPAPTSAPPPVAVASSLRQAARVSVEQSSSEPGLYLVRVLEEGRAPQAGCTEALLVSLDPGGGPFAVSSSS